MVRKLDTGQDKVTKNDTFIFPRGNKLSGNELIAFIGYNETVLNKRYITNMNYYLGKHAILSENSFKSDNIDNRIVDNKIKPLVDSYNGFFIGIPPTITATDDSVNEEVQTWNNENLIQDQLNEISKQTDIYGRSIAFIYQGEDSKPHLKYSSPSHAFIIYDDTVERNPLAFVRYELEDGETYTEAYGQIQYADKIYKFKGSEISDDTDTNEYAANPYGIVPAVEFYENEERQGIFEQIIYLQDELDHAMSQKANQIAYFDNAYMYMFGINLSEDEDGNPEFNFKKNRLIYSPNIDPSTKPEIGFISKPDADGMQENMIDHLQKSIYENTGIANLRDENFAGNSSGIAMQYKLLSMKDKADSKERKFTQSLKKIYQIVFATLFSDKTKQQAWSNLKFHFTRNLPDDIAALISSAKNAEGLVSHQTQLSLLPFIKDPRAELDQISKEKAEAIKQAQQSMQSVPDYLLEDKPDEKED